MERSCCRRLVQLTMFTLCGLCTAGDIVNVTTAGNGQFINIVERGFVFLNHHHLTFRLKACHDSVIVFSSIVALSDNKGNYFLLLIGSNKNRLVTVEDSCFSCEGSTKRKLSLLKCDQFVSFWVSWDEKGQLLFGTGNHPGNNTLLEMKGSRQHYPVRNIAVTSTKRATAQWIFDSGKIPPAFIHPLPGGLSLIPMNEALPVGSEVARILLRSAPLNTTFTLSGESANLFTIREGAITLTRGLNYCQRRFHVIQLRSSKTGLATSVTVEVVRSQCGRSGVHILSSLLLLEELPVGAVIPWIRQISATGDNCTYTLHGPLVDYFDIQHGELLLRKRLDVDKDTSIPRVVNMAISRGNVLHNVSVSISDVNDNPPEFERELYVLSTELNFSTDTHLVDMACHDGDISDAGVFHLSISHSALNVFYVKNTSLFMRSGLALSQPHAYSFLVWVADTSSIRVTQTGTAVVVVKILPTAGHSGHISARAGQSGHSQAHFDKEIYEIKEEHFHTGVDKPHLTFRVKGLTEPQDLRIVLDKNGEEYFHIQKRQSSFQLLLKKRITKDSGFPSIILMNLMNPLKKLKISTAYILIRRFLAACPVPDVRDVPKGVTGRGYRQHVEQENGCSPQDKTMENVLITISVYEGAGLLALFVVYKKRRRKERFKRHRKDSSPTTPVRQEPVGCEAESDARETAVDELNKQHTPDSRTKTPCPSFNMEVGFEKARFNGDSTDTEDSLPNTRKSRIINYQGDRSMPLFDNITTLAPNSAGDGGGDDSMSVCDSVFTVAPNCVADGGGDESMSISEDVYTTALNTVADDDGDESMSICDVVYTVTPDSAGDGGVEKNISKYDYVYTTAPNTVADDDGDESMSISDDVYTMAPDSAGDGGGDEGISVCDSVYTVAPNTVAEDEGDGKYDSCSLDEDDKFASQHPILASHANVMILSEDRRNK